MLAMNRIKVDAYGYHATRVMKPSVLLGRSIFDGIADGIDESASNLLHGEFDEDDDNFDVDPLCQLGGDRFDLIEKLGRDVSVPAAMSPDGVDHTSDLMPPENVE